MVTDAVPQVMELVGSSSIYGVAAVTALGMLTENCVCISLLFPFIESPKRIYSKPNSTI
jgi:hypothetical protein